MKDEIFLKKLGQRIQSLREKQGISQRELGRKIGTSNMQIVRLEAGSTNCSILTLRTIASEFDLPLSSLIEFK